MESTRPLFHRLANREAINFKSSAGGKRFNAGGVVADFSGEFALNNPLGTFWPDYVQTGVLNFSEGSDSEIGGFDSIRITANGSAINIPGTWVNIGSGSISIINGAINDITIIKQNNRICYSVKIASSASSGRTIIYKTNNPATPTLTGVTTEQIMDSFQIPAGVIQANDILNIVVTCSKSGTAGTLTLRVKANATNVLAGATTILTYLTAAANLWLKQARELLFKNSLSSQVTFNATITSLSEQGGASNAKSTLAIDFSAAQYIIVSFQNSSAADSSTLEGWYLEIIR